MTVRTLLALAAAAACAACSSGGDQVLSDGDADTAADEAVVEAETEGGCTADEQCNDAIACTIDACAFGGVCSNTPVDALCGEDEKCVLGEGCVTVECTSSAECDDSVGCTEDLCEAGWTCAHVPHSELCEDDETCYAGVGCAKQCLGAEECQDGDFCNGEERCDPEFGCRPAAGPRTCNDGDPCTNDSCDATKDTCRNVCVPSTECACPFNPADVYHGCFSITPSATQTCAFGRVSYAINRLCFTLTGPILTGAVGPTFHSSSSSFTQTPAPDGPTFTVSRDIAGDCNEHYEIGGTFSDNDNFTGVWIANYYGGASCALGGCVAQSMPITGARIP